MDWVKGAHSVFLLPLLPLGGSLHPHRYLRLNKTVWKSLLQLPKLLILQTRNQRPRELNCIAGVLTTTAKPEAESRSLELHAVVSAATSLWWGPSLGSLHPRILGTYGKSWWHMFCRLALNYLPHMLTAFWVSSHSVEVLGWIKVKNEN